MTATGQLSSRIQKLEASAAPLHVVVTRFSGGELSLPISYRTKTGQAVEVTFCEAGFLSATGQQHG